MVKIFSIEGNIGSGKSTLIEVLKATATKSYIIFMKEPVDIWNTIKDEAGETMLSKFYKDQDTYAFSFQMMAYISRISKLRNIIRKYPNATIITERSVFTDKNVFAQMLYDDTKIESVNYQIYLKWFDEFIQDIPLTGIIYVRASPEKCFERVQKRSREGETISLEYLKNCHAYHEKWLNTEPSICTLDANPDREKIERDYDKWVFIISKYIERNTKPTNKCLSDADKMNAEVCWQTHGG